MKTINSLINSSQAEISSGKVLQKTLRQSTGLPKDQIKIVTFFWTEMVDRFPKQWRKDWGEMTENGQLTANFLEWCHETKGLTLRQWRYGLDAIDARISIDVGRGKDPWPPSTPKIFVAMCSPPKKELVSEEGLARASQTNYFSKDHPRFDLSSREYCGVTFEEHEKSRLRLSDQGAIDRTNKAGNTALKEMMKDL